MPAEIETMMTNFHAAMTPEDQTDPRFAYRVAFVPKVGARASNSDLAIEFVKPGSDEAKKISVLLKEVDRSRHTSSQICKKMQDAGYPKFKLHHHTDLWRA